MVARYEKSSVFSDSKAILYNPDTLEEKMQLMCGCYNIDTPRNIAFDDSVAISFGCDIFVDVSPGLGGTSHQKLSARLR